ncbi:GIN domain-containing protein [Carboxylicivirga caseinilyticus]|uniref:GIN domain-containing protein n=1 Tax=Carboxylicivirga caseinilyticus TaxID=3417572 RepID=UPI003D334143|nr:DUF2807 domain-containing protein [Marinilabiliaceae bacterium A049]
MKAVVFITFMVLLISCTTQDCECAFSSEVIVGSGEVITKTFDVDDFISVSILSFTDIKIETGKQQSVTISGQKNIMELLQVGVGSKNLDLSFPDNQDIRPTEDLTAIISMPDALEAFSFVGLAEIELTGEAQTDLAVNITGSANFNSVDLPVDKVVINWVGEGSATVWSIEQLILNCTGVFDIKYKGEPTITNNSVGTVTVDPIS